VPECILKAVQLPSPERALARAVKRSPLIEQAVQLTGENGALVGTDKATIGAGRTK
jgi:hypothetical protein